MGIAFQRNADGSVTGRNEDTGFAVTDFDEEEVKRRMYEDAGWTYAPPPPPVAPGFHRFALANEDSGDDGFQDARFARLRANPPSGCVPEDWGYFALRCERPGATLLDAVADTVAEIRREYGLTMNSLGIEKPDEWLGNDKNGYGAQIVGHLLLKAVHRARLLGYGREDLVRFLDAAGAE